MGSTSTITDVASFADFDLGEFGPYFEIISVGNPHDENDGIEVTHLEYLSRRMKLLQDCLRRFKPRLIAPSGMFDLGSIRLKPPKHRALRGCKWAERLLGGTYIYDVRSKKRRGIGQFPKKRIYYLAGGCWQDTPSLAHWRFVAELARQVPNAIVSLISQPLAPVSPAPVAMPHLSHVYKKLMQQSRVNGERVIWAGDGSGANVALGQVIWSLSRENEMGPAGVMAICPPTDLKHMDERILEIVDKDPILTLPLIHGTAQTWVSSLDRSLLKTDVLPMPNGNMFEVTDPRVSPINAQLNMFAAFNVKVHGVTAGYDLLSPEG